MPAVHRPATQSPEVQAATLGMLGILRLGDRAVGERRPPRSECSAYCGSAIARLASVGRRAPLAIGPRLGDRRELGDDVVVAADGAVPGERGLGDAPCVGRAGGY